MNEAHARRRLYRLGEERYRDRLMLAWARATLPFLLTALAGAGLALMLQPQPRPTTIIQMMPTAVIRPTFRSWPSVACGLRNLL